MKRLGRGRGNEPLGDVSGPGDGARGEGDPPSWFTYLSITTTVKPTAEPSDRRAKRQRRGDGVRHCQKRERAAKPIKGGADQAADETAVIDDPPLPDLKNIRKCLNALWMSQNVKAPCADNSAREQPDRQFEHRLGREPLSTGPPDRQGQAGDHRQAQKDAETVEREPGRLPEHSSQGTPPVPEPDPSATRSPRRMPGNPGSINPTFPTSRASVAWNLIYPNFGFS